MSGRILFVAATRSEAEIISRLNLRNKSYGGSPDVSPEFLVTGVGAAATAWELQTWIFKNGKPDIAINIGIAGSYRDEIGIGEVVMPVTDCFADSGIEDDARFMTLFEAGLADKNDFPYSEGVLKADGELTDSLNKMIRPVNAVTVNMATGSESTRERLALKFNPDIETLEGATFFYICKRENVPFLAVRAISNMVGKRDREKWDIKLALYNMAITIEEVIKKLR